MRYNIGSDHMTDTPPTIPPPPWVHNATCYSPLLVHNLHALDENPIDAGHVLRFLVLLITAILTIVANAFFVVVLNTQHYSQWIRPQPRFILISMSVSDLAVGTLVMTSEIYPVLFECWPFGEMLCQIQALFRGALTQQSALILIVLAVERFLAAVHPLSYSTLCNKKVCVIVILLSWSTSFTLYGLIVIPPNGFHFNINGLMVCEPYYMSNNVLILASCVFYFPTTMVLMYCYGTIFHSNKVKNRYRSVVFSTFPFIPGESVAKRNEKMAEQRRICEITSRSTAAISLTFIVVVTPWAIQQVITSCTRTKAPALIEFLVTWLASSHSFWSPVIFWMLNEKFRRSSEKFFITKIQGRPLPLTWHSAEGSMNGETLDVAGEKLWGEILERTVSSHSLHQLRVHNGHSNGCPKSNVRPWEKGKEEDTDEPNTESI